MSKRPSVTPELEADLFPLEDPGPIGELGEDFADRFAELMIRSDQEFMNEINRRNEEFMRDLAREHDKDISAFLQRMREDPIGNGKFEPPGSRERSPSRAGGVYHRPKNREIEADHETNIREFVDSLK